MARGHDHPVGFSQRRLRGGDQSRSPGMGLCLGYTETPKQKNIAVVDDGIASGNSWS